MATPEALMAEVAMKEARMATEAAETVVWTVVAASGEAID